jgi:hypothetical protein
MAGQTLDPVLLIPLIATLAPGSTASIRSRTVTPYKAADLLATDSGCQKTD